MLFILTRSIIPFCDAISGEELDGLQNLLLSVRQGHHAISGPYEAFKKLSNNNNLSARERATALSLANRRSELPKLEEIIKHKIFVEATVAPKSPRRLNEYCWSVEAKDLSRNFLSCLVVLAENIVDAELYQRAALHYRIANNITGLTIKSQARGGGGSQIDVELNSLLKSGTPVIAITDGDCNFEHAPASVISERCNDLVNNNSGIGWHTPVPAREIENILPHDVLSEVADPQISDEAYRTVKQLAQAKSKDGVCPSRFSCLKSGTTLSQIFNINNDAERTYWLNIAEKIKNQKSHLFNSCLSNSSCEKNVCECIVNKGFGNAVLVQVKLWMEHRSPHESLKKFKENEIWLDIGSRVFETGAAFSPKNI